MLKHIILAALLGAAVSAPSAQAGTAVQKAVDYIAAIDAREIYCTGPEDHQCDRTTWTYRALARDCTLTVTAAGRIQRQSRADRTERTEETFELDLTNLKVVAGAFNDYWAKLYAVWVGRPKLTESGAGQRTEWIMRFPGARKPDESRRFKAVLAAAIAECRQEGGRSVSRGTVK